MPESIALNCDCMEYMRSLPDKAFDIAVVDPPYGGGCSQSVKAERESWVILLIKHCGLWP